MVPVRFNLSQIPRSPRALTLLCNEQSTRVYNCQIKKLWVPSVLYRNHLFNRFKNSRVKRYRNNKTALQVYQQAKLCSKYRYLTAPLILIWQLRYHRNLGCLILSWVKLRLLETNRTPHKGSSPNFLRLKWIYRLALSLLEVHIWSAKIVRNLSRFQARPQLVRTRRMSGALVACLSKLLIICRTL